jgi:hypothetical protein
MCQDLRHKAEKSGVLSRFEPFLNFGSKKYKEAKIKEKR